MTKLNKNNKPTPKTKTNNTLNQKDFEKAKAELIKHGIHHHAELFPLQTEKELYLLTDDIKKYGLKEPIKTINGQIIDGRNRFMACKIAKIEPQFEEIKEKDTLSFVVALNIHRRQLTTSQKAITAAKIAEFRSTKYKDDIAASIGISPRTFHTGVAVLKNGTEKLISRVSNGQLSISMAEKVSRMPEEKKQELSDASVKEIKEYFSEKEELSASVFFKVKLKNEDAKLINTVSKKIKKSKEEFIQMAIKKYLESAEAELV